MNTYFFRSLILASAIGVVSCNQTKKTASSEDDTANEAKATQTEIQFNGDTSTTGMVQIPGGTFMMGGDNSQADKDEYPKHKVIVDGFYMDEHEVTNAQFQKFVDATGYVTTAEQKPDWEQLKKTLPPGTARPADEMLVAASLVFKPTSGPVDLRDYSKWWSWVA